MLHQLHPNGPRLAAQSSCDLDWALANCVTNWFLPFVQLCRFTQKCSAWGCKVCREKTFVSVEGSQMANFWVWLGGQSKTSSALSSPQPNASIFRRKRKTTMCFSDLAALLFFACSLLLQVDRGFMWLAIDCTFVVVERNVGTTFKEFYFLNGTIDV